MSLLSRFARSKAPADVLPELPDNCGHWEMAPRWDNAADIGKNDRVVALACTSCGEVFTPEEAKRIAVA